MKPVSVFAATVTASGLGLFCFPPVAHARDAAAEVKVFKIYYGTSNLQGLKGSIQVRFSGEGYVAVDNGGYSAGASSDTQNDPPQQVSGTLSGVVTNPTNQTIYLPFYKDGLDGPSYVPEADLSGYAYTDYPTSTASCSLSLGSDSVNGKVAGRNGRYLERTASLFVNPAFALQPGQKIELQGSFSVAADGGKP